MHVPFPNCTAVAAHSVSGSHASKNTSRLHMPTAHKWEIFIYLAALRPLAAVMPTRKGAAQAARNAAVPHVGETDKGEWGSVTVGAF